jgi:hypothetical protein
LTKFSKRQFSLFTQTLKQKSQCRLSHYTSLDKASRVIYAVV